MAITRRTREQIENDCRRIKEAAKTAKTMKELENLTGLSYMMINTTLSKHPTIHKRIKEQLADNKEKTVIEYKKEPEECVTDNKEDFYGFVIDASITGVENLRNILLKICQTQAKIILTSITIKELEKLQKLKDIQGKDARYILSLAAENSTTFKTVLIDETLRCPDDCIIKYCEENKKNVTLLTADKTMALKARMYSVQVQYFKYDRINTSRKVITLIPANKIGSKLIISKFQTSTLSIRVYSDGIQYNDGIKELNVGDDVFIATKKMGYITFAHYSVICLEEENNCELIYYCRIYDDEKINLTNAEYKAFIKDFKFRLNL